MSILRKLALTTAAGAFCVTAIAPAYASSHREAPNITKLRKVDNTDFYMFRSYEPGREAMVTIIANFQPAQFPGDGPNYFTMDTDAVYEIHIDSNGDSAEDLTYSFKFTNTLRNANSGISLNVGGKDVPIALRQIGPIAAPNDQMLNETETYSLTQITGDRRTGTRARIASPQGGGNFFKPFDNAGNKTLPDYNAYANQFIYDVAVPGCGPGRVFVGQRAEAFAINLSDTFDLVNYVPIEGDSAPFAGDGGGFSGGITQNRTNDDLIGKNNVTSFALELPIACLTGTGNGTIGAWSTASLPQQRALDPTPTYENNARNGGALVQVSRLANPLVNELVIGLPVKDVFNSAEPRGDAAVADFVTNPTFPAILDTLFRRPVNATLGTNFTNLAPTNFPRADLVATFLTGIRGLNQQSRQRPAEIMRLNTGIMPTPRESQQNLGVVADDLAGYPNGRRPGDDAADITLRVAMGRLCHPVPINGVPTDLALCAPSDAPTGLVAFTDGAPVSARDLQNVFPYLNPPIPGSPRAVRMAAAMQPAQP